MRKRARTVLCGGRSAMVVPTASTGKHDHGIPENSLDPVFSLANGDILPCVISSELRKRDPIGRFESEPVLRRKGHRSDPKPAETQLPRPVVEV
jgi:hypothetical protein